MRVQVVMLILSWITKSLSLSSQDAFLSQDSEKSEKKNIILWLAYPFKWGCLIFFNIYSFVVCVVCTCEHIMALMGRLEDKLQESVLSFSHRVSPGAQTKGRRLGRSTLPCWANSLAPEWDTGGLACSTSIAVHALCALQLQHTGAEGWHVHVLKHALWTRNAPHSCSRAARQGIKWPGNPSSSVQPLPAHIHTPELWSKTRPSACKRKICFLQRNLTGDIKHTSGRPMSSSRWPHKTKTKVF